MAPVGAERHTSSLTLDSNTDGANTSTALPIAGGRKLQEYVEEAEGLPPKLLTNLASLQKFDATELQAATNRPLSLLAFLVMRPAGEALGTAGLPYLPNLLGILGRIIRKEGSALQLRKLYVVQFLYSETQSGGCLYGLLKGDPLSVIAICLSALTYDVAGVSKATACSSSHRQTTFESAVSIGNDSSRRSTLPRRQSTDRTTANIAQTRAVRSLLVQTAYFRALPCGEATRLLSLVSEINEVGDPNTLQAMLNREEAMQLAGSEAHVLQATLVVAANSHLMRKFKVHLNWCTHRMTALQNSTIKSDGVSVFAFPPGDHTNTRFAKSHVWTIDNVILPFMCMWARMVGGTNAKRLCHAASRTGRTYEMTYKAPAFGLGPGAIHTSVPVRLKAETSPVQLMIDSGNIRCPLVAWNRDGVAIPEDVNGMLSVCRMYNINAEYVLSRRCSQQQDASETDGRSSRPVKRVSLY